MTDPLVRLLQANECRPFLARLRKKLEQGELLAGIVRLNRLSDAERQKTAELTGAKSRGQTMAIDLDSFAQIVCNTGRFGSLRELVELAIGHAVENRREARQTIANQWSGVWEQVEPRVSGSRKLVEFTTELRRSGWLSRVTRRDPVAAAAMIIQALDLLEKLPTDPSPLAIFSAEHTGDSHALDAGNPLSRLLLRMIAAQGDCGNAGEIEAAHENRTSRRRQVWESVGLVPDELTSTVLVLNLPAIGDSLSDRLLREHHRTGMPLRLTFRHLRLHPPDVSSADIGPRWLYVCESPGVIAAAADRLGARCPALLCVEGQPSLTCWALLERLSGAGFRFRYHGDFDWGGLRIANQIFDRFGFEPWRFSAADHKLTSAHHRKLRPPVAEAKWDANLANTIASSGVVIEEESVIDDLLRDLQFE